MTKPLALLGFVLGAVWLALLACTPAAGQHSVQLVQQRLQQAQDHFVADRRKLLEDWITAQGDRAQEAAGARAGSAQDAARAGGEAS